MSLLGRVFWVLVMLTAGTFGAAFWAAVVIEGPVSADTDANLDRANQSRTPAEMIRHLDAFKAGLLRHNLENLDFGPGGSRDVDPVTKVEQAIERCKVVDSLNPNSSEYEGTLRGLRYSLRRSQNYASVVSVRRVGWVTGVGFLLLLLTAAAGLAHATERLPNR